MKGPGFFAVSALAALLLLPAASQGDLMDALVGKRDHSVDEALKRGAKELYKPLPAEEVARLPQEERMQYVLDNIYWAKVYKRFPEGKASRDAAVDAMKLIVETASPAEFVALWSGVDSKFIAALNGDDSSSRTVRRIALNEQRSTTLYALSWADITAVLTEYPAYRKRATGYLLQLAADGNFGACRVFETLYDTGIGSNPFAGKADATWLDVNGVGQRRGLPLGVIDDTPPPPPQDDSGVSPIYLPLPQAAVEVRTVTIPLPVAVLNGCQHIRSGGGDASYRSMVEGHFRDIAKEFSR